MAEPNLITIRTASGVPFTVAREHAERFKGLLDDLEAGGYGFDASQSGGYNPRNIAGTNIPSPHSFGRAVDVNWNDNPRGGIGKIPADLARSLAQKHGMTWGGDWRNPDPMHFEVASASPAPIASRGITSFAGLSNGGGGQPPTASPSEPSSGKSPMVDYSYDDSELSPEAVEFKRRNAIESYRQSQRYPGGRGLGALAMALSGALSGYEERQANEGERIGRASLIKTLSDPNMTAEAKLTKAIGTPYGSTMMPAFTHVLQGNIQEQSPRGQLELEQLRLQNEMLKRKDWLSDAIAKEMGLSVPPPVGSTPAAPPAAMPSPPAPAGAPTTLTNVPGTVVAPAAAPGVPSPVPAALPGGKTLKQLFAERTPAERLEFLMAYQKDPAKASEIINKWANPLNAQEQERQKQVGEAVGKAQVDLPRIEANVNRVLKQVDEVAADKNLPNVTGWNAKTPTIRPTSIATEDRIKQLGGAAFLEMYNALRGGGAITEAEGAKATAALARLNIAQDTKSFRQALRDFRNEVVNLRDVARQRAAGVGSSPTPGSQAASATIPTVANPSAALEAAKAAIAKGAPPEKVIERLRENGVDPSGLGL